MLVRELRRIIILVGPVLFLLFLGLKLSRNRSVVWSYLGDRLEENPVSVDTKEPSSAPLHSFIAIITSNGKPDTVMGEAPDRTSNSPGPTPGSEKSAQLGNQDEAPQNSDEKSHYEVFSASTADGSYFKIKFDNREAMNANIIPHAVLNDTWIIVAQKQRSKVENSIWFSELVCNAVFMNGTLGCIDSPEILPIAATSGDKCVGEWAYAALNIGPHDARVFYGPRIPYAMYGSNSGYTCFGLWMLDFRILVDWGFESYAKEEFRNATELQRPVPYGNMEKNWFIFWDKNERMHAHYDIVPKRVFAELEFDGSAGQDLAPLAADSDEKCMARYMPRVAPELESIHQATNSLSITLCKRADPSCEMSDSNTFIFTVFQHKSYYSFHSVYEPYAMVFGWTAPFEIYGISKKPIWIHGRQKTGEGENQSVPGQSEMFYITSLSWKAQGQKYHGYVDDVLFIAFGIEDSDTAGIDVVAGDLFTDLGLCSTT